MKLMMLFAVRNRVEQEFGNPASKPARQSQILIPRPLFVKMACKQYLDLGCVLISDPSTLGAGAKTRLESRIKKFTRHCVCRPCGKRSSLPRHGNPNLEIKMAQNIRVCFAPGTFGARGPNQDTSPIQHFKKKT